MQGIAARHYRRLGIQNPEPVFLFDKFQLMPYNITVFVYYKIPKRRKEFIVDDLKPYDLSKSRLVTSLINVFCYIARMMLCVAIFGKESLPSILLIDTTIGLTVAVIYAKISKVHDPKDHIITTLFSLLGWPILAFGIYCYVSLEWDKRYD